MLSVGAKKYNYSCHYRFTNMAVCNMRDHMHLFVAAFVQLRLDGEIHFEKIIERSTCCHLPI